MKIKTYSLIMLGCISLVSLSYANCGNDNGNGNGCSGNTGNQGPTGPQGPQGPAGNNGTNGTNGVNGKDGTNGTNGVNGATGATGATGADNNGDISRYRGTNLSLDVAVRLFDTKYVQGQVFDTYVVGSHPGDDVFAQGYNSQIGLRIVFKLGKSYEEREIEKLKKLLGVH